MATKYEKSFPTFSNLKLAEDVFEDLDKLSVECQSWERTEHKTATTRLYILLAEIYSVYEQKFVKVSDEKRRTLRKQLASKLNAAGIQVRKSSDTLGLLIRYIFKVDRRRVVNYKKAIVAAKTHGKGPADFAQWLSDEGGIDEVSKNVSESKEAQEREKAAAKAFNAVVKKIGESYQSPLGTVNVQCDAVGSEVMMLAKSCGNGQFNIVYVFDDPSSGIKNMLIRKAAAKSESDKAENKAVADEAMSFSNVALIDETETEIAL